MFRRAAVCGLVVAAILSDQPSWWTGVPTPHPAQNVEFVGEAHAQEADAAVCEHLTHAYPTPARMAVALGDERNVQFICPGDPDLGLIIYTLRDTGDLEYWRANRPDSTILPGEGEED